MIKNILNIFNKVFTVPNMIMLGLIGTLSVGTVYLYKQNHKLDSAIGTLQSDKFALLEDTFKLGKSNRILNLTVQEFQNSNNILIQKLDSVATELKINKSKLNYALAAATKIEVVATTPAEPIIQVPECNIDSTFCDFNVLFDLNEFTKIEVGRINDQYFTKTDISDNLYFYIDDKKVYRNKRKNFFDRLFHSDFKRDLVYDYQLKNDNVEYIEFNEVHVLKFK